MTHSFATYGRHGSNTRRTDNNTQEVSMFHYLGGGFWEIHQQDQLPWAGGEGGVY